MSGGEPIFANNGMALSFRQSSQSQIEHRSAGVPIFPCLVAFFSCGLTRA